MIAEHLVVDSSAFIHSGPIRESGKHIYTCQEAINEIKDQGTLEKLKFLPYELKIIQFDKEEFDQCCEFAKKTGDYRQLSVVDLKLIAATYRLEKQHNGTRYINETPKQVAVKPLEKTPKPLDSDWITPENFEKFAKSSQNPIAAGDDDDVHMDLADRRVTVACMTSDFSIQNCLLQMGLQVVSPIDGMIIKEAKKIALRCHACYKVFHDLSKVRNSFCPHCGNLDTLKRVQYIIEQNGEIRVLINFKRPIKVKGTNKQLPRPRGGKHSNNPILAPDQRVRKEKQEKLTLDDKKSLTAEHILQDPAYVVRTNPFAQRSIQTRRRRK